MGISRTLAALVLSTLAACLAASPRPHDDAGPRAPARVRAQADDVEGDGWRFVLAPYGGLLLLNGEGDVGIQTGETEEDLGDLFGTVSYMVEGRFEAWRGDTGMLLDLAYSQLHSDLTKGNNVGRFDGDWMLALIGGIHRLYEQPGTDASGGATLDGMAGIALTTFDVKMDYSLTDPEEGDEAFVDPFFGLRARFSFNDRWAASLESIIGGFDTFDGSNLMTRSTLLVGRTMSDGARLYFGWRAQQLQFDNGEESYLKDRFDLNLTTHGPILGYEWSF